MRNVIDDLTIKTQIFEIMHKKVDYLKKKDLLKNRSKIF